MSLFSELFFKRRREFSKLSTGYMCFGCGVRYTRLRHLRLHQQQLWPGCWSSISEDSKLLAPPTIIS